MVIFFLKNVHVLCSSPFLFLLNGGFFLQKNLTQHFQFVVQGLMQDICTCVNSLLYNNPSNSRILIGSRLWSIRGQTHRWQQRSIQVLLNFLNFEFEPITILCNQSVRFIFYRHKITSVLFSCLSKWRNFK